MTARRARRLAFILAASDYGPMIVNRLDIDTEHACSGVGVNILEFGHNVPDEIGVIEGFFDEIAKVRSPPFLFFDGGANIGDHTVPIGKFLEGRGAVVAVECQFPAYLALCGNIALNNLINNCTPMLVMIGRTSASHPIQQWDYDKPANFGGARPFGQPNIGRPPDSVMTMISKDIDSMSLPRLDVLKLDIEGMEPDALVGAKAKIDRDRPIIFAEHHYCGIDKIVAVTPGYDWQPFGMMAIGRPEAGLAL